MQNFFIQFATVPAHCAKNFLGLVPWYQYLDFNNNTCDIKNFYIFPGGGHSSSIPLILAAVVDDLLRIAGIIAVVFVIYGAIKYIASQGSPDAASNAQGTIINALVGLAISITGVALVNFIGTQVGK